MLRQTYSDNGVWKHRDLMDLGWNPGECILYPGGNGFYFDPEIEETLGKLGVRYSSDDLEQAFRPFLKYRIRQIIDRYGHGPSAISSNACPMDELSEHYPELHWFDRRRLQYLYFGHLTMGKGMPRRMKFLDRLLCRSRDEIENIVERMERKLGSGEAGRYVYAAFRLHARFPNNLLKQHPAALNQDKLAEFFLEELCLLNLDATFFRGVEDHDSGNLHPYLTRYAMLFFDSGFDRDQGWDEFLYETMRKRFTSRPAPRRSMTDMDALILFGISVERFRAMSRRELIRTFRSKAKKVHPDRGGDHDEFVRLAQAYEALLARK